jgi:hypothetical protein
MCEHKFVHLQNVSYWEEYGYRGHRFVSTDYFFCEKCLERKETKKEYTCNQGEFEIRPDWCRQIKLQSL